ncbi:FAD binding domain-containing protein [Evtepia sp.]|uniref:FAD binding domain-containing protein n=1 Tax=Evtepia sp. TaxID=2773933 RepID=UPI003F14C142
MNYIIAKSAAEALDALLGGEGNALIIAGGSDVMVDIEAGKLAPQTLVDVTAAEDMKGIRVEDGQLVIGAAVTLTEIARSPVVRQYFPSLCKGAGSVGSLQIRNSATLVGNVVTAQPAGDAAMAVAPLDPKFVVLSKDGTREVPMGEMYAGFGKSTLNSAAEVVKEVRIPLPADDEKASFVRLELRKSLSLPMLNVAAMAKVTDGIVQWARITMGPVGVGPTRALEAEEWLKGKALTPENMAEAGTLALRNAKPRSNPLRGSKEYREHALPILVRRSLEGIAKQMGLLAL